MTTNKQGVRDLNGSKLKPPEPKPTTPLERIKSIPFREDIMEYFTFDHLPAGPMRAMSAMFTGLAEFVHANTPRCAERSSALRKLLEGKDAAVRAAKPRP